MTLSLEHFQEDGLLVIVTPDSCHQGRNRKQLAAWHRGLVALGTRCSISGLKFSMKKFCTVVLNQWCGFALLYSNISIIIFCLGWGILGPCDDADPDSWIKQCLSTIPYPSINTYVPATYQYVFKKSVKTYKKQNDEQNILFPKAVFLHRHWTSFLRFFIWTF